MTLASAPQSVTKLGGLLGVLGMLVLLDQVTGILTTVWPITPDQLQWRYAAYGLVAARLSPLLLADLLLVAGTLLAGGWPSRLVVGILNALLALMLLGGAALFALDAVQMNPLLPLASRTTAWVAGLRSAVFGVAGGLVLAWVAIKLLRTARPDSPSKRGPRPLIVASEAGE